MSDSRSRAQIGEEIRAVLETFPHSPKAHVQSFGCQLNFCDGEKYKGILQDLGYELTDTPEEADVILYNACAVRAHAESRVIGRLGALKSIREKNPRLIVGLCGCMAEEEEVRALVTSAMQNALPLEGIRIDVGIDVGDNWLAAH